MGDQLPTVKVAAVQAASVFLDREATVDRASELIRQAGRNGACLVAFPENFVPGHPYWFAFHPVASRVSMRLSQRLFQNSVAVPSESLTAIAGAAADAGAYVVLGMTQKAPDSTGTMYNAQVVVGPGGQLIGVRQKLVPTVGERIVHAPGGGDGIRVFPTEFGPISGLVCAENSNPLATFAMLALGTRIHVAAWPAFFQAGFDMQEQMDISARAIAQQNACFVINVCGAIDPALADILEVGDDDRAWLADEGRKGGSAIYAPGGKRLAGPLEGGEGVLYADLDLEQIVSRKLVKDYAGHYNRFDVFELRLHDGGTAVPLTLVDREPEPRLVGAGAAGPAHAAEPSSEPTGARDASPLPPGSAPGIVPTET
jgi:aliphatic nitrilase